MNNTKSKSDCWRRTLVSRHLDDKKYHLSATSSIVILSYCCFSKVMLWCWLAS